MLVFTDLYSILEKSFAQPMNYSAFFCSFPPSVSCIEIILQAKQAWLELHLEYLKTLFHCLLWLSDWQHTVFLWENTVQLSNTEVNQSLICWWDTATHDASNALLPHFPVCRLFCFTSLPSYSSHKQKPHRTKHWGLPRCQVTVSSSDLLSIPWSHWAAPSNHWK